MKSIYLSLIITVCFSCNDSNLFKDQAIIIKQFPKTVHVKGENTDLEIIGINNLYLVDTFLIAYTALHSDSYFKIYSTNTYNYIGDFLPIGRGPNEFYAISYFNCYDITPQLTSIWLQNALIAYRWNITESVKQKTTIIDSTILLKGILAEGIWLHGNRNLLKAEYSKNNMNYQVYDITQNKIIQNHRVFPSNISRRLLPLVTIDFKLKPDKNRIAMLGGNLNSICIYDVSFSNTIYRTIYDESISLEKNIKLKEEDRTVYYSDSRLTDQYIYGLYLSQPEKNRRYHSGNEEIHIFDWEGNPVMKIVVAENIMFFTVDEKNKCLYGLTSDEKIYKYDLTEYLTAL